MAPRIPGNKPGGDPDKMNLLGGGLFEFLFRLITGDSGWFGSNGFVGGIFSRIVEATTLQGMRWGQMDKQAEDLGKLQDQTQYLLGVLGYAHSYATSELSLTLGDMKRPMTNQIGRAIGVQFVNGAFVLQTRGLWVADAHQTFDEYLVGSQGIWCGIRVYSPSGALFAERYTHATESQASTLTVHLPFTVPAPGYRVEMWVHAALGRGIWGGSANAGLSVKKEDTETS